MNAVIAPTSFLANPAVKPQERFGRMGGGMAKAPLFYLAPNAMESFWNDTAGVYLPKVPTWRSKIQAFKDTFLEFVEDGAFYFTAPLAGPLLARGHEKGQQLSQLIAQHTIDPALKAGAHQQALEWLGTPFHQVEAHVARTIKASARPQVLEHIASAKAGTLLGVVAVASGLEFLIPHFNNLISAKVFKATNFTATAGLEKQRTELKAGEVDIVARGKKRIRQVGAITAGVLGASVLLPTLLKGRSAPVQGFLRFFDFAANPAKKVFYDLSKPLLAVTIAHGVASYLDASQSPLERKETGLRLAFVVPYLLAMGEVTKNTLGWLAQNQTVEHNGKRWIIGDGKNVPAPLKALFKHQQAEGALGINFIDGSKSLKKVFTQPQHFLNFNFLKDSGVIKEAVDAVQKNGLHLSDEAAMKVFQKFNTIDATSFGVKVFGMGIAVNLASYALTRHRFDKSKQTDEIPGKSRTNEAGHKHPHEKASKTKQGDSALQTAATAQTLVYEPKPFPGALPNSPVTPPLPVTAPVTTTTRFNPPSLALQQNPFSQPLAFPPTSLTALPNASSAAPLPLQPAPVWTRQTFAV